MKGGEKKEMQTDGGGAHEEEDEQDRQWEGVSARKRGIVNCRENLTIQPAEVKGMRGEKNACIVVFVIWLPSFCCICEMEEVDEREKRRRRRRTRMRREERQEGRGEEEEEKKKKGGRKSCEINLLCRALHSHRHAQTKAWTWSSCLGVIDE